MSLGKVPQDKKVAGGFTGRLRIGARNKLRERESALNPKDRGITTLGDDNMLLIAAHVGHDCALGSHVLMTNGALLAGHTSVADRAILGALIAVHQFCRVRWRCSAVR